MVITNISIPDVGILDLWTMEGISIFFKNWFLGLKY